MQQRSTFFESIPHLEIGDVIVVDHDDESFRDMIGVRMMKEGIRVISRKIHGRLIARRVE